MATVLVLADEGRKSDAVAKVAVALLAEGKRVVVVDPFYFGEAKMAEKDYLWPLMIATVGERPLGIQVGQVLAAARAFQSADSQLPVSIVAIGPRTGLIALVAAALDPEGLDGGVEMHDPPGSLKEIIEKGMIFQNRPEWFCFGLLESFDVKTIAALVVPRSVRWLDADDRARDGLGEIREWRRWLGL